MIILVVVGFGILLRKKKHDHRLVSTWSGQQCQAGWRDPRGSYVILYKYDQVTIQL